MYSNIFNTQNDTEMFKLEKVQTTGLSFREVPGKTGDWGKSRQDAAKSAWDIPYNWDIQNIGVPFCLTGTPGKERRDVAVICEEENRCLTAAVSGELDHHRAKEVMEELDRQIDAALPRKLTLDLSGLTFTDSSGIAVILRTYRRMSQLQGGMTVVHAPDQARRVFRAAGLEKRVRFE